jgi:hypothetical protein
MMKLFKYLLIIYFVNSANNSIAQVFVTASATLDTNRIRIGEQIKLELKINYDKNRINKKIVWPSVNDTIRKEIDVISKTNPKEIPSKEKSSATFVQTLQLTSFDSGFWVIPPFKFKVEGDSNAIAETEALLIEVQTVPTDTAEASIKDIKPIMEEKWDWRAYLPLLYWGIGILAILTLAVYIGYRYAKSRKKKPEIKVIPGEPPHVTALRELNAVKETKIWKEGKFKEYYTSITEILRRYLEGRFGVAAMELTTEEIIQVMRSLVIDEESKRKMKQLLELSDYVKFAKATPIEIENDLTLQNAYDFVNGTCRNEETKPNSSTNISSEQ